MMVLCVALVSIGGLLDVEDESGEEAKQTEDEKNEQIMGLIFAVISAAVTGFLFTMNALSI